MLQKQAHIYIFNTWEEQQCLLRQRGLLPEKCHVYIHLKYDTTYVNVYGRIENKYVYV